MKRYTVKYKRGSSNSISSQSVTAPSMAQAKEKIKSQFNGDVKIISCVER